MSDYYDKDGRCVNLEEYNKLYQIKNYKFVHDTTTKEGYWISTVWIGLDYSFGKGSPMIFETMIFPCKGEGGELYMNRYHTVEEAKKGHQYVVDNYKKLINKYV